MYALLNFLKNPITLPFQALSVPIPSKARTEALIRQINELENDFFRDGIQSLGIGKGRLHDLGINEAMKPLEEVTKVVSLLLLLLLLLLVV